MSEADREEALARVRTAKEIGGTGAANLAALGALGHAPDPISVEDLSNAVCLDDNGSFGLPYQLSGLQALHIVGVVGAVSKAELRIVGRTDRSKYVTIPLGDELVAQELAKVGISENLTVGSPIEVWCSVEHPNQDEDPSVQISLCLKSVVGSKQSTLDLGNPTSPAPQTSDIPRP